MEEEWASFFQDFASYVEAIAEKESSASLEESADIIVELDRYLLCLNNLILMVEDASVQDDTDSAMNELDELKHDLSEIVDSLQRILSVWIEKEAGVRGCPIGGVQVSRSGMCGRPKFIIPSHTLLFLRELRFSWTNISSLLGISRRTLFSVRQDLGFDSIDPGVFSLISDDDLHEQIRTIKVHMPDAGMRMIKGVLHSQGIHVSFLRVRDAMYEVDPIGTRSRWAAAIKRRQYCVQAPNCLWHIDGHHKLVRWRLVIHGGIDGFARFIVYLRCSANNTSGTVLSLFRAAVREYGLPDQVRSDRGGENVKVAAYMLQNSHHANSMLTGSSTHNQRIERLWRDVFRCAVTVYHQLFHYLEECGKLDPLSDTDLYCLHLVYLPKINEVLKSFVDGWNSHAITTEHNMTPLQLFSTGSILKPQSQASLPFDDMNECEDVADDVSMVEVPPTHIVLSPEKHTELSLLLQTANTTSNFNIDVYDLVRHFVYQNVDHQ